MSDEERSASELAEAIRALVAEGTAPKQETSNDPLDLPEPAFQQHIAELMENGNGAQALQLTQARLIRVQQQVASAGQGMIAEHAEMLAKQSMGEDIAKWMPQLEELAKTNNVNVHQFTSVKQWQEAIDYVKAKNLNKILAEEREKLLKEAANANAPKDEYNDMIFAEDSKTPEDKPGEQAIVELTADEQKHAKSLNMSPREYKLQILALQKGDTGYGKVEEVPLLDSDLLSIRKNGRVVVERGKF